MSSWGVMKKYPIIFGANSLLISQREDTDSCSYFTFLPEMHELLWRKENQLKWW